ncbi:hypothetical protein Esti_006646 [Eimeria stiedai]
MLVPKNGDPPDSPGSRLVVNYRPLNAVTIAAEVPLPVIEDLLASLRGATFTTLDMRQGFHQVRMAPEDRHKTAFRTFVGQFEWRVMPFGLKGAPSTFQAIMNSIFFDMSGQRVLTYTDDVLVYAATFEEHLRVLDSVLARPLQHKMYPKIVKCKFAAQSIEYLRYRTAAGPTEAEGIFHCTAAHSSVVQALKDCLIHYTKLSLPDMTKPFALRTDASGVAIGAGGKPLGFVSERLSDAEMRYSTYDQELHAIVRDLESWRHLLIAAEVTIYTDHQALQCLTKLRCDRPIRGRLARWLGFLADLQHLIIVYQPGATNEVADALSRCPGYEQDPQHASFKFLSVSSLPPTAPQQSRIPASNLPEPAVRASLLLARAKVGRRPRLQFQSNTNSGPSHGSPSPLLPDNVQASPQSSLSDPEMQGVGDEAWGASLQSCSEFGAAYKRAKETHPEPHHDLPAASHLGISKTYNQIAMKFFWKGIRENGDGYDTILTVVDSLSKMAHFIPTKSSLCAADFVRVFADRVVRYHGLPITIVSDRDPCWH